MDAAKFGCTTHLVPGSDRMKLSLMIAFTSLSLAVACGGSADPATEPRLGQPSSVAASCVSRYSPENVGERAFAFDGTVESVEMRVDPNLPIEEDQSPNLAWTTFKVNRWFKGGESPKVETWVDPHTPGGVWPLVPGDRILIAGEYRWGQPPENPLAWGCGFTQLYTPEAAAQWADAMIALTAMPSN